MRDDELAEKGVLVVNGGPIRALAFAPDSRQLAGGNEDGSVVLWDVAQRGEAILLTGHHDAVTCVAFSPDGQLLASAGRDHDVRLWHGTTGQMRAALAGHTDTVHCLAFRPDGQVLASGGEDGTVRLWDVPGGRWRQTLSCACEPVLAIAFGPGRELRAVCSRTSRVVHTWDLATGTHAAAATNVGLFGLTFSSDARLLAGAEGGGNVRVWDLRAGRQQAYLDPWKVGSVPWLAFAPDNATLAVAHFGGVTLWNTRTRAVRHVLDRPFAEDGTAIAVSPDGVHLAAGITRTPNVGHGRHAIKVWHLPGPFRHSA
jgi:WD40 repeat protein